MSKVGVLPCAQHPLSDIFYKGVRRDELTVNYGELTRTNDELTIDIKEYSSLSNVGVLLHPHHFSVDIYTIRAVSYTHLTLPTIYSV